MAGELAGRRVAALVANGFEQVELGRDGPERGSRPWVGVSSRA